MRLNSLSLAHSGTTLFGSARGYDAVGNVTAVNTTLSAGTDNQAYCYDEQNRLVWAGSTGTPSCGASLTPGSLTAANYTQTFAYDTLNRITSGPLGSYAYGDSAHLDAATSIGIGGTNSYTAKYDALGDMTCRAPSNTTTCAGTSTGATLSYDNEGRLSAWQDKPSSPTTTDSFLYDGSGNRVEQSVTVNGSITTTTTYIAGGLEESTTTGASTTLTKYFPGPNGLPTTERVGTGGPLSVLATDGQGTVSTSLDSAGNVTSAQLFTPYGVSRYSSGSSPTAHGYTGQLADSSTGLDYYNARYYDPVAGQFTSADTVDDGFNRYAYVRGNPTTHTDPTGHARNCKHDEACDSAPEDSGQGVDWGDNVRIAPEGIAGCNAGCAQASKGGAIVGPGKRTDKSDGKTPITYVWGDKNNGAIAYGFSGEQLQALIDMDKAVLSDVNKGKYDAAKAAIQAFFAAVGAGLGALFGWISAIFGAAGGAFVGSVLAAKLDAVKQILGDAISALTDAKTSGESVWYVQSRWQGHAGKYGSDFGSSDFDIGVSPYDPPLEVLHSVGWMMMSQCADYANNHPASPWGNSPGLTPEQDHSYSPPPPPAGC